jgi:hypothetical protein
VSAVGRAEARPRPPPASTYLAFASGALTYDCAPCARCCRGLGFADVADHAKTSPSLARLAAFAAAPRPGDPLVGFFTYADGCRYLSDDRACEVHRRLGAGAKPAICRLFPFSRLVDLDGLWTLLPHGACPWQAAPPGVADSRSAHAGVLAELGPVLARGASPELVPSVTTLAPDERRVLEERLRDLPWLDDVDRLLVAQAELQHELVGPVLARPPLEVWLDLLRSAGEPPALEPENDRILCATLPALRVLLAPHLPLAVIPAGLAAFSLWLRTASELGRRVFTGADVLHLFEAARPLLRVLAYAGEPLPWGRAPLPPMLEQARSSVGGTDDEPLGELLLRFFRADQQGVLSILMQLGEALPAWEPDARRSMA